MSSRRSDIPAADTPAGGEVAGAPREAADAAEPTDAPGGSPAPGGPGPAGSGDLVSPVGSRAGWVDSLRSNGLLLAVLFALVLTGAILQKQPALTLRVLWLLIFASLNVPLLGGLRALVGRFRRLTPLQRFGIGAGILLAANVLVGVLLPTLGLADVSARAAPYYTRVLMLIGFNVVLAVGLQLINGFSGQFSLGHAGFMAVGAYLAAYPAKFHAHLSNTTAGRLRIDDPGGAAVYYLALGIIVAVAGGALALLFRGLRETRRLHPQLPALLVLAVAAWMLWDVAFSSRYAAPPGWLVWSNSASRLQRLFSWVLTHWSPGASRASASMPEGVRETACFLVLVLGGGLFAAAAGLVVGLPTLRLRGDYLAIATLGLAEIIRICIQNSAPLGGALGLTAIPKYTNFAWLYGAAIVTIIVVWRLAYSAKGRAIQAVREDEIAAAAVGIDTTRQKVTAFIAGAFFGGVAGALFSMNERSITPGYFGLQKSIEVVVIVTLGGLGSISGAVLAAVVLTLLPEVLRPVADFRMIIYSLLLVGMMLLRPQGLLGGRELWPVRRRRAARESADPSRPASASKHDSAPRAAGSRDSVLDIQSVSRRFGGLAALTDFSLRIQPGELVGLIGPNGAGKTTAFNLITGVYPPSSGAITLAGRRIDGLPPVAINRAGIARTFQNIRLFKSLSALDNVAAGFNRKAEHSLSRTILRTPGFFKEASRSEAEALRLLTTLGLADDADLPAGSLPYGDQRRLEIARALATRPKILLLDEPAAGMNPQEKRELMDLIRFIRDTFGVGILLIEHDMKLVMNICERITVLDHGETIAVGTPEEVQRNPDVCEAYLGEPVSGDAGVVPI